MLARYALSFISLSPSFDLMEPWQPAHPLPLARLCVLDWAVCQAEKAPVERCSIAIWGSHPLGGQKGYKPFVLGEPP